MADLAADVVRERIKHYSDQGVFQGYLETDAGRGKTLFAFRWLLGQEFSLVLDPAKQQLVMRNLLPCVENRSFIDSDLRLFVANRSALTLPKHRRLDIDRVSLSYTNRKQNVSLIMLTPGKHYEYAVKSLLDTLNELFTYLHLYHIDYLQQNFGVAEE
jgi:hypothetical protein